MIANQPGVVRLDSGGERMRVTMRRIEDADLLTHLPESRRLPSGSMYSIVPTPYTCWQLRRQGFYLADESLDMLSLQWSAGQIGGDYMTKFISSMTPAAHQVQAFNYSFYKPATMLGMDMGTRKTSTSISLMEAWHAAGITLFPDFIVCPQNVIEQWPEQWRKFGGTQPRIVTLTEKQSTKKKAAIVAEEYRLWEVAVARGEPRHLVFVNNHESVWRPELAKVLLSRQWGTGLIDESHRVKGHSSNVGKFAYQFGKRCLKKLALSGTPMGNNPGDIFGQYRFLDAGIFGTAWRKFKADFATDHPHVKHAVGEWINQDRLAELVNLIMFSVRIRDVMDLPPVTDIVVPVKVDPKLKRAYNALAKEMCTEWEGREITVDNVLTKMLRLQQLTSGHLVDDDGNVMHVCNGKSDALVELLNDMSPDEPVVVFTRFREEQAAHRRAIEAKTNRRYLEVSSSRKEHREFIGNPKPGDVLVAQIQACGTGVDGLQSRARYSVYSSIGNNRPEYEQSRARLARDGQKQAMIVYHLRVPGSIDHDLAVAFDRKGEVVNYVMERMTAL